MIRDGAFRLGIEIWVAGTISLLLAIFLYVGVTRIYVMTGTKLLFENENSASSGGGNNNSEDSGVANSRNLEGKHSGFANNDHNNNPAHTKNSFAYK